MKLITNINDFISFEQQLDKTRLIALDCETYGQRPTQPNAQLLGLAISGYKYGSNEILSAYLCFKHYNKQTKEFNYYIDYDWILLEYFIMECKAIGWNVAFDNMWISSVCVKPSWHADGRILWHLQNNDISIRGYGLKLAQKKLLNWEVSNDTALENNVKKYGGKLREGDHYLADLEILAHYACLDTTSTLLTVEKLLLWIEKRNYLGFAKQILDYSLLLNEAGNQGLKVNQQLLLESKALYEQKKIEAEKALREECKSEITSLEHTWKVEKASKFKRETSRTLYLEDETRHKKFNPASGTQRETLLHTMLELHIFERTSTGRAKTDRATLALHNKKATELLIQYSECKKITEQIQTILDHTIQGLLYTNYDVCGTVSGRLAGFKPSLLNLPFSEEDVMKGFEAPEGWVGIHADLASIEPCVLAHYSEDPTLLKVYKENKGDIYLDLALDMFPNNEELKIEYDPNKPIDSRIKSKFKDIRNICKTIHLAVSYTGTSVTVAKNLTKSGFPTTRGEAQLLVKGYWNKFSRVKQFDRRINDIYNKVGQLRNIVGRVIQVPEEYQKDLMNRLIQSSAHDILRLWVVEIVTEFKIQNIKYKHWLPDIHDSTTYIIKQQDKERATQVFRKTLYKIEKQLNLIIPLKMELKFIKNLAGVKGAE